MKEETVGNEGRRIDLAHWKACLVTSQKSLEELLVEYLDLKNLRVKERLVDLIGERDCNLYIVDTKTPDMHVWPAPILADSHSRLMPWIFLLSRTSDTYSLNPLPTNTMFFGRNKPALGALKSLLTKLLDPELGKRIERVSYLDRLRSFVVHMGNTKAYMLKIADLAEADSSHVIKYRIGKNRYYIEVLQESGNSF
jgi:hypothetical protein